MPFVVASRPSIEIGATCLIARVIGTLALTPPVMARVMGAAAASRRSRIRWSRFLDLIDLDLGHLKMRGNLFNF